MWVTDSRWVILDTVFRVVSEDEEAAGLVAALLKSFETTPLPARATNIIQITRQDDGYVTAYKNCHRIASEPGNWDEFLTMVIGVINNAAVDRCPHFAVHSGVVSNGSTTIALPAATGGGKSTLTAALVKEGFSYMSDEALVISDDGRAIPYPKPIALSPWSSESLGLDHGGVERLLMPDDLGVKAEQSRLPVGHVVMMERSAGTAELEPIPRSETMKALIELSFNHYKDPERAFRLASDVARSAEAWRLAYEDPLDAARVMRSEFS